MQSEPAQPTAHLHSPAAAVEEACTHTLRLEVPPDRAQSASLVHGHGIDDRQGWDVTGDTVSPQRAMPSLPTDGAKASPLRLTQVTVRERVPQPQRAVAPEALPTWVVGVHTPHADTLQAAISLKQGARLQGTEVSGSAAPLASQLDTSTGASLRRQDTPEGVVTPREPDVSSAHTAEHAVHGPTAW